MRMNEICGRTAFVVLLATLVAGLLGGCSSGTPRIPFPGIRQKSVLYDDWSQCPNGDGNDVRAYQLYPLNATRWIRESRRAGNNWVQGPVSDPRYEGAFWWSETSSDEHSPPRWPYSQWLKSSSFFFMLEDYKETHYSTSRSIPHHSTIWALDTKSYRLYYVSGSQ